MNRNKRYVAAAVVCASLIVAPVLSFVNFNQNVNLAEGSPLPPPVPHTPTAQSVTIAEGSPLPAPVPHPPMAQPVTIAEGSPLPPPVPHLPVLAA